MGIIFERAGVTYGPVQALKNVQLRIGPGITAIMGKNGAGKSTLLELAASLIKPTQGEMRLDGVRYASAAAVLRRSLGYLPQAVDFPEQLTPRKVLAFLARLRFLEPQEGLYWVEQLGVAHLVDRRFEEISSGETRLVGIAQALMGAPQWLILDEFSRNLSLEERTRVRLCLRQYLMDHPERTLLFSTHFYEDVEALADEVVYLDAGEVTFSGKPERLFRDEHR